ncbi:MAG TPA: DUF3800 domain-containing protein [Actinophytocola sp.]|uniref:DUF3800 domain-containing protein n=1 Tax=Actinophytocola sp. TaxID=1872138 RepID=UPI002DBE40FA|nr:DUF3800 domain-containing protein [Actinophytocola sp.]HEU5474802.1 DUF3800 domain-containing protein [Actinophytocola sp.]
MTPTPPDPASPVRLFYVDDSGAEETGYIVYSWIECTVTSWANGLLSWFRFRRELYASYRIRPSVELHSTRFIANRGRPSTNLGVNMSWQARHDVAVRALAAIGQCPDLKVGTVYRRTSARRRGYATERDTVYIELVRWLDERLGGAREYGVVVMDGDGTAAGYCDAHRSLRLPTRRIIEDPMFVPAHRSHWVQMADIAAWSAYQSLLRHPGKRFAWDWYDRYLGPSDVNGGPLAL